MRFVSILKSFLKKGPEKYRRTSNMVRRYPLVTENILYIKAELVCYQHIYTEASYIQKGQF